MPIPHFPDPQGLVGEVLRIAGQQFGTCCSCECVNTPSNPVQNILLLHRKLPVPSRRKWGCIICQLSGDGACAVLCDRCLTMGADIKYVVVNEERLPLAECIEDFRHDTSKHMPSTRRQLEGLMAARDRRN